MKTVTEMYNKSFMGRRYKHSWRAPYVINAIEKTFSMAERDSYIDVGCATGDLVAEALKRKWDARGIDGSDWAKEFLEIPKDKFCTADLRRSLHKQLVLGDRRYDLCTAFEVAEHIEEEFADKFVENLCILSYNILISAAIPGQGGHYHFNCQLPEYWDAKFREHEYQRMPALETMFKRVLVPWRKKDGIRAFYNNCLIYRRF